MDQPPLETAAPEGPGPAPELAAPEPLPLEFELQRAQGDAIEGPYDRVSLQEMLYTGVLKGSERVRVPGESAFVPLSERAELHFIRDRFFGEAVRARGSLNAAPEPRAAPSPAAEAAVSEAMQKAGIKPQRLAVIVVVTLLVCVALMVALFVSQL